MFSGEDEQRRILANYIFNLALYGCEISFREISTKKFSIYKPTFHVSERLDLAPIQHTHSLI